MVEMASGWRYGQKVHSNFLNTVFLMSSFPKGYMAAKRRKMSPGYLKTCELNKDNLKESGLRLITHLMKEFKKDQTRLKTLVNEILHSIFFLGIINKKPISPEDILSAKIAATVKQEFPEPFENYKSHLPRRTPFSGLLDMMKLKYDSKDTVMDGLCSLMKELEFPKPLKKPGSTNQNYYTLESTVICVCFNDSISSNKYFGASVGCKEAKSIMIYSSCINDTWHEYVSHAVMSFNQQTVGDSLKFPGSVQCQAYHRNWTTNTYEEKPPCWKCQQIFNLPGPSVTKQINYPYGNCAETECLSKLVLEDPSVREQTVIDNHTGDTMRQLKESTKKYLREMLALIPSFSQTMLNNDDLPLFNP